MRRAKTTATAAAPVSRPGQDAEDADELDLPVIPAGEAKL
jgi:hypothetical protein